MSDAKVKKMSVSKLIMLAVASVAVLALLLYHFVFSTLSPYKTEVAHSYHLVKTINTTMYTIREEQYINNVTNGTYVPLISNGSRVGVNNNVALVFSDANSAGNYEKLKKIQSEIDYYSSLSGLSGMQQIDLNSLDSVIYKCIDNYVDVAYSNNFSAMQNAIIAVRDSITQRQTITGQSIDYSSVVAQLTAEYNALLPYVTNYTEIKSPSTGYFVSELDGYETAVDFSGVSNLTVENIDALLGAAPSPVPSNAAGKLITSYTWYLACNLNIKDVDNLEIGSTVKISFPYSGIDNLSVSVFKMTPGQDNRIAVIFKTNAMNSALAGLRIDEAEICVEEFVGYKLSKSCLRIVDGQDGVYVKKNNIVFFKPIVTVYEDEESILIKEYDGSSSLVKLYDEVFIEGNDLYDRKLLN